MIIVEGNRLRGGHVDNTQTINILSLCTGYGGLELGLARALEGVFRVIAVEVEAYALANLAAKAQESKLAIEVMWPDLKTFPAERFRGCFDFILAGYPCQPFSVAGKRKGTDDPRHLWPHIARIIKAIQPVFCFFENVRGHLSIGYESVYRELRSLQYSIEAGVFSAAECGLFQQRERLYILAYSHKIHLQSGCMLGPSAIRKTSQQHQRIHSLEREYQRNKGSEPKPRLVRMAHGTFQELDEFRYDLLGNGVIPQQAEKAFRHLMRLFESRE